MAYILRRGNLLAELREEVLPAVNAGTHGLEYRLEGQCPRLRAVYLEVLRLSASSSTLRGVMTTTEIGDQIFKGGAKVLIPYRQLHMNPEIFGRNAEQFDPDRFLHDKDLSKNPSFRPFGGGRTYCPGRYLAEREILTFIALAVARFDIEVFDERGFPRMDKEKFCLGIMEPVKGDDMVLTIKPRKA